MDYLSPLDLYLLIEPLAVTAALGPALGGAAGRAGIEAAQAVLVQAVAEVHAAEDEQPLAVVHLALGGNDLPARETRWLAPHTLAVHPQLHGANGRQRRRRHTAWACAL